MTTAVMSLAGLLLSFLKGPLLMLSSSELRTGVVHSAFLCHCPRFRGAKQDFCCCSVVVQSFHRAMFISLNLFTYGFYCFREGD